MLAVHVTGRNELNPPTRITLTAIIACRKELRGGGGPAEITAAVGPCDVELVLLAKVADYDHRCFGYTQDPPKGCTCSCLRSST